MHKCKVISRKAEIITKEEYERHLQRVSADSFFHAVRKAREQVMGQPFEPEIYWYEKDFTLTMTRNVFGLFVVEVYINHVRCRFIIDTGAQISGMKAEKSAQIKLRETKGKLSIGSIGGKEKVMKGLCANSFQLGGVEFRELPMIELDRSDFSLRFGNIDLFNFDGILGWDILSQLDFELDDIQGEFKVLQNRLRIEHPNMIVGGFPCLIVRMKNGNTALFGFDSGSKYSWIGEKEALQEQLHISKEGNVLGFGVHGLESMELKCIEEMECYLDKAHIKLKDTMSGRVQLFPHFTFTGVLGNEIFRRRRIRFINSRSMVLLA